MSTLIDIQDITVKYDKFVALSNASMKIEENDFIGVIGPNGGGKTTLFKSVLGLIQPSSGKIQYSDILPNQNGSIGYLPQVNKFDNSFPITVYEVVLSGLALPDNLYFKKNKKNREEVFHVLAELGIEELALKPIGELSGGQMQKVFLGRALISNPKLLVLDEPDTYVDSRFENELYEKLKELNKKMAILLVSHDVGTISAHVKSIACVNRKLNYHSSNIISPEQLASYNCPIQMITHGDVPHTVLSKHNHN